MTLTTAPLIAPPSASAPLAYAPSASAASACAPSASTAGPTGAASPARTVHASAPTERSSAAPVAAGRFTIMRRLHLRHAGWHDVTISGEWVGELDAPVVIVAGGISADRHVVASQTYAEPGWWEALAGPHRALDPTRHRLLAIDWLGVEGDLDVPIDTADQAAAIVAALDHLGIRRSAAFVGSSYGGMVGLQLAALDPERLGRLVAISAAHRPHPYASAWRGVQRRILALGRSHGAEEEALSLARQLAMLSYRTPADFARRFDSPAIVEHSHVECPADSYLESCGTRFVERFHPTAWLRLSESIDLHRVDPISITVPTTAIAVTEDRLVPAADIAELAAWLGGAGELQVIHSQYGHDAFLKEPDAIGRIVHKALLGIGTGAA